MQLIEHHGVEFEESADQPTLTVPYLLRDVLDEATAKVTLMAALPAVRNGLVLQNFRCSSLGGMVWDVTAKYGKKKPIEVGEFDFSFDTTGGSTKITQSPSTESYGEAPPDFQGAIAVRQDQIEGVDKKFKGFAFQVKRKYKFTELPSDFILGLYRKTTGVNEDTFVINYKGQVLIFQGGEVQFLGATGQSTGDDEIEVLYKFEASPNASNLTIGDITEIIKLGFDYLWVLYEDETSNNFLVRRPKAVYVERIYDFITFAELILE